MCACFCSQVASTKKRPVSSTIVQNAWAAYARYQSPSEGQNATKVTREKGAVLSVTQGVGACVVALAENRGREYLQVQLRITSTGLRYTRQQPATTDWLKPGFGQIVQVALPATEQTNAGWFSLPQLATSKVAPSRIAHGKEPWHLPDLDVGCVLHTPFRLEKDQPTFLQPVLPHDAETTATLPPCLLVRPGEAMVSASSTSRACAKQFAPASDHRIVSV